MILTPEQRKEMLEAAKPLIKWLNENCHPHCEATVDHNTVVLTEGVACQRTDEFLSGPRNQISTSQELTNGWIADNWEKREEQREKVVFTKIIDDTFKICDQMSKRTEEAE
jgi:hypothetical protein